MKWHKFTPGKGANRQKLPKFKKYVLVRLRQPNPGFPDPVVVGYLKYHSGERNKPYFVTPGATLEGAHLDGDDRVIEWCDCLPDDFEWPFQVESP